MTLLDASWARAQILVDGIVAGVPVSGSDWAQVANAQRWLLSRNRSLVPSFKPSHGALTKSTRYDYAFRLVPSLHAFQRRWSVTMRDSDAVTFTIESVTREIAAALSYSIVDPVTRATPATTTIDVASQTVSESSVDLIITGLQSGRVDNIACVEVPRGSIDDGSTEDGAPVSGFYSGQPVTAASLAKLSETHLDTSFGKRVHLHWAVPYKVATVLSTTFAKTSASTTYVDILDVAAPILGRTLYSGDTARTVTCKVFGWTTSTAVAQGRATSTSAGAGSNTALSLTNTPGWSDAFTVDVDAEDLTEADGLPSSTWDDIQVAFRRSSGAGSVYVTSAIIYET